jgi:hypothetical protein
VLVVLVIAEVDDVVVLHELDVPRAQLRSTTFVLKRGRINIIPSAQLWLKVGGVPGVE